MKSTGRVHAYKWHSTADSNALWHCRDTLTTHTHPLRPVCHWVPPDGSIIHQPQHTRLFITHLFFPSRCHREGSRQPACCARLFDVPIICPNVDWSVYQFIQLMMVDSSQHHRCHTVMTCWCTYWSRCLPLKGLQQTFNFLIFNSLFGQHITIMLAREYQTWILIQSCL